MGTKISSQLRNGLFQGVVHTHGSLFSNIDMMRVAWGMTQNDTLLHVLPLHHVHGIVNCLMTPLSVGATCVMMPKFDAQQVSEDGDFGTKLFLRSCKN